MKKIKQPYRSMATLAGLVLLCACTQDVGVADDTVGNGSLAVRSVSMSDMGGDTRASQLPTPVAGGKLGVGIRGQNGYAENRNLSYTYTSGSWKGSQEVPLTQNPISLYAWYPWDLGKTDGDNIPMTAQSYNESKDLCYAMSGGENVSKLHPYAGFVLQHAYARIKLELLILDADDVTVLESVRISATSGLKNSGTLVTRTGTINTTGVDDVPSYQWTSGKTMAELPGRKYTNDWLAIPAASLTGSKLTVTLDGTNWTADISTALTKLEQGKVYRIKAIIGIFLVIESVTIEDWTAGGSYNGDTQFE